MIIITIIVIVHSIRIKMEDGTVNIKNSENACRVEE